MSLSTHVNKQKFVYNVNLERKEQLHGQSTEAKITTTGFMDALLTCASLY